VGTLVIFGHWLRPIVLSLSLALVTACTEVVLVEESPAVCVNGADDDGNGLTDCDDPGCEVSGVCESSMAACTNGFDDDADGLTDCEEAPCRTNGACDSAPTECAVLPQSGCRPGMGCYRRGRGATMTELRCRSGGVGRQGAFCSLDEIDALTPPDAHPCAVGFGCNTATSIGACSAYCMSDADCATGGVCYPLPSTTGFPGLCTTPCDPRVAGACASGLDCYSFHERGDTYANGGARWACVDDSLVHGTADVGDSCEDGAAPGTPTAEICRQSAACIPDLGGATATCRRLCNVLMADCGAGEICDRLYPGFSPSAVGATVFGVCR